MGKKVAWVTDTAALLTEEFIRKHNIHVLALNVVFEESAFRETIDMTHDEFYHKLRNSKEHPKTSQPTFGEHVALYERLKEEGYDYAIAIHTSEQLSGTVVSSPMAAEQAGFKNFAIDSKIGSYPMQVMLEKGLELEKQGLEPEQIVQQIEAMCDKADLTFIPASLGQLHKSGRVSGTAMLLSNLLNIKLVIGFNKLGSPEVLQKVRADKRAKKCAVERLQEAIAKSPVTEVAVINCNNEAGAVEWKEELEVQFPTINFIPTPLSACVGVHAGEGTLGLTWVRQ
ncbi:fatty acid-binding protein DegV [Solibacillus sp. R5-41]|uniref:DegV family protein n=1 Tax=Solibacillus sp. R5-41 TaxID=2048654 RepID=UPI000C128DB3|nr:DegV family protein [Solibacillus sp. R5-41]ATP41068.1 fatty acid-binding protein DegV [Solibacillus sp. R5-41]